MTTELALTLEELPEPTAVELSLDAALELEEMLQGAEVASSSFRRLVEYLKSPRAAYSGPAASMLADVRSVSVWKSALRQRQLGDIPNSDVQKIVTDYLDGLATGIGASTRFREGLIHDSS